MKRITYILFIIAIILPATSNAQNGLVGYWSFDKVGDEIFRDQTSYSNDGITFGADKTNGIKGTALTFNGIDAFAEIHGDRTNPPTILSNLGEGSISVWFKVDYIPLEFGIAPILYYGSTEKCDFYDAANKGLIIELGHSPIYPGQENLYFTIWANGCTYPTFCFDSGYAITKGEWNHFVAVVGENYNTGYLNGQEMTDRDYNFGDASYSQFFEDAVVHEELWIGKGHWDGTEQFFDGAIDELKIFNKALSSAEVEQLYNEVKFSTSTEIFEQFSALRNIYPNPASEKITLDFTNFDFDVKWIRLVDITGKQVMFEDKISNEIFLDDFPAGLYSLSFIGKEKIVSEKVLIVK